MWTNWELKPLLAISMMRWNSSFHCSDNLDVFSVVLRIKYHLKSWWDRGWRAPILDMFHRPGSWLKIDWILYPPPIMLNIFEYWSCNFNHNFCHIPVLASLGSLNLGPCPKAYGASTITVLSQQGVTHKSALARLFFLCWLGRPHCSIVLFSGGR